MTNDASKDPGRGKSKIKDLPYRSTPVFDESSLPKGLKKAHLTKKGTWGLLELVSGKLVYVLENSQARIEMSAGDLQIIKPEVLHHVELIDPVKMQVHFYRSRPHVI